MLEDICQIFSTGPRSSFLMVSSHKPIPASNPPHLSNDFATHHARTQRSISQLRHQRNVDPDHQLLGGAMPKLPN